MNLALASTGEANEFHKVLRLSGVKAWRRIVMPLKPRSEAKRNALHSLVPNLAKSRSFTVMVDDIDE